MLTKPLQQSTFIPKLTGPNKSFEEDFNFNDDHSQLTDSKSQKEFLKPSRGVHRRK